MAPFDIRDLSNGENFFFLGRERLIDVSDGSIGHLLNLVRKALLIVLGDLVILFELFEDIKSITAHVTNRNACGLGIFVRDLYEFLAALFVELGNPQADDPGLRSPG